MPTHQKKARSEPKTPRPKKIDKGAALAASAPPIEKPATDRSGPEGGKTLRLMGFAAIEYAEKHGLPLNKHPDSLTGPRMGISVGEASAIADEDPDLIWLEVRAE